MMDFPSGPNPAADCGAAERDVDRATQHQDKEESERGDLSPTFVAPSEEPTPGAYNAGATSQEESPDTITKTLQSEAE